MKKVALLVPVAALALAGCAHDPTIAAKVAGQSVPVSDVNIMVTFLCASISTQAAQGAQVVPMSQVTQIASTYLVGAKALADLARRRGVTIPPVSPTAMNPLIAAMPAAQRARATSIVGEVDSALNLIAQQVGANNIQQVLSTMASLVHAESAAGRVVANPAYPTLADDGSGSLSTAESAVAQAGALVQPNADYVATLPAGQKCG